MELLISALMTAILLAAGPGSQGDSTGELQGAATESRTGTSSVAESAGQAVAQPPPAPPVERKRNKSFTGYLDDATVTSQLRVRFDLGFGVNAPDRAEFFYAKCGCYVFDPLPDQDLDAPGPGPGVPTELNFQQLYVQGEYAVQRRLSLFAELPIRAIQPQGFEPFGSPYDPFPDQSGLGDIRAGAKVAMIADDDRDLTLQLRASFPTGDPRKGLSTDTVTIEPTLLYREGITDRLGLAAQIGSLHPFGGSAGVSAVDSERFSGTIISYGIGAGYDLATTNTLRFAPVVELVGWRIVGGAQTLCPGAVCNYDADDNVVNLKLGARVTIADRSSVYAGYGWALTDAVWYARVFRMEYRHQF
jgi:hypothetical protein